MVQFIDDHRGSYGIEQICRVLPITPSTYDGAKGLERYLEQRLRRSQFDHFYIREIKRIWQNSKCRYSVRKVCQ